MSLPTPEQLDAAKAWLEQWVPGYSLGQYAALAELLAATPASEPPKGAAERRPGTYVFLNVGGEALLDGSPTELFATDLAAALERAEQLGRQLCAELRHVGFWADATSSTHRTFEAAVPYEQLPAWAQQWIDEQRESAVQKARPRARAKKGRAA